jgi:PIN domain nuclease of toxin-antitoxin system
MQSKYIADTMAFILRLEKRKLPKKVSQIFEDAENHNALVYIPSIVFAEIGYLAENNKIDTNLNKAKIYCNNYNSFIVKDMSLKTIENAFKIKDIPELHDRIIAGTALEYNLEILSNDPKILKSKFVKAIWE